MSTKTSSPLVCASKDYMEKQALLQKLMAGGKGLVDDAAGLYGKASQGVSGAYGKAAEGAADAYGKASQGVASAYGKASQGVSGAYGKATDAVRGADQSVENWMEPFLRKLVTMGNTGSRKMRTAGIKADTWDEFRRFNGKGIFEGVGDAPSMLQQPDIRKALAMRLQESRKASPITPSAEGKHDMYRGLQLAGGVGGASAGGIAALQHALRDYDGGPDSSPDKRASIQMLKEAGMWNKALSWAGGQAGKLNQGLNKALTPAAQALNRHTAAAGRQAGRGGLVEQYTNFMGKHAPGSVSGAMTRGSAYRNGLARQMRTSRWVGDMPQMQQAGALEGTLGNMKLGLGMGVGGVGALGAGALMQGGGGGQQQGYAPSMYGQPNGGYNQFQPQPSYQSPGAANRLLQMISSGQFGNFGPGGPPPPGTMLGSAGMYKGASMEKLAFNPMQFLRMGNAAIPGTGAAMGGAAKAGSWLRQNTIGHTLGAIPKLAQYGLGKITPRFLGGGYMLRGAQKYVDGAPGLTGLAMRGGRGMLRGSGMTKMAPWMTALGASGATAYGVGNYAQGQAEDMAAQAVHGYQTLPLYKRMAAAVSPSLVDGYLPENVLQRLANYRMGGAGA